MIEYLCSGKYPGAEIGPEPTTDIFAHIQYNKDPVQIDGQTLAHDKNYPLKGLEMFGDPFLNKLRSTNFDSELLQYVSILDTPGILAGKKQTDARGYDFAAVISFLAERVDKIFLMFDANKVDLSDEYRDVIKSLDGHSEKVRIVLNKADMMKPRELIHVRGALMWALGKIFTTPEVPKVYIGSFWKYVSLENQMSKTMKEDTDALVKEICELVHTCRGRRINDVVRRAKSVRIHCYLMDTIRRSQLLFFNMPTAVTRKKLARHFAIVERRYRVVHSDMPSEEAFQAKALKTEGSMWKKIDSFDMKLLNSFLNDDITAIIAVANREKQEEVNFTIKERTEKPPDDETDWKTAQSRITGR
uniref:DUF5600 domain-containing protein n=1 Tax=Panagrellus redivivus TaxID=6233 RepID=A0A7E4ZS97_PANRE